MAEDEVAEVINALPKVVFSRSIGSAALNNTRLAGENAAAEVRRLKDETGMDLLVFGSAVILHHRPA